MLCLLLLNRSRTRRTEVHKHNHSKNTIFTTSQFLNTFKKTHEKTFTKKGTTKTPAKTSTPTKHQNGDTRNNEYLVQQQNRVQYRTISKYKTPDKMEKTSENQPHQTNGERVKVTFVCTARKHTVSMMYAASTIHASMQRITHNIDKICTEQDQATRCTVSAV